MQNNSSISINTLLKRNIIWILLFWLIGYIPFVLASYEIFPESFGFTLFLIGGASPTLGAILTLSKEEKKRIKSIIIN